MRLKIFALIYTTFTLLLIRSIYADQSSSLGYGFLILFLWIFGIIVLSIFLYKKTIKIETKLDWFFFQNWA